MNDETRDRAVLHEIENDWREAIAAIKTVQAEEMGAVTRSIAAIHREYRRAAIWLVLVSIGLLGVVVGGLVAQEAQTDGLREIQADQPASRKRAAVDACNERNRIAGGIIYFISRVAPEVEADAPRTFRQQASCELYAEAVLANHAPPPTVPGHSIPPRP